MENQQSMKNRITHFVTGPDSEKDFVTVEEILMKLAMAGSVIRDMASFIKAVEVNDGVCPDEVEAPDTWALTGLNQNLFEINHALKSACFGWEKANLH